MSDRAGSVGSIPIQVRGVARDPDFQTSVRDRVRAVLRRANVGAVTAMVTFADQNGPKRGPDTRCTLVVGMPGRRTLRVAEVATDRTLAFSQCLSAVERELTERKGKRRELARRPKKYFLAKRLLASAASDDRARPREPRP
jgi:hypothetical protein